MAVNIDPGNTLQEWADFWGSNRAASVIFATDADGSAVRAFRVIALGTTIIIDRRGRVSYRDAGPTSYDTLKGEIEKVL